MREWSIGSSRRYAGESGRVRGSVKNVQSRTVTIQIRIQRRRALGGCERLRRNRRTCGSSTGSDAGVRDQREEEVGRWCLKTTCRRSRWRGRVTMQCKTRQSLTSPRDHREGSKSPEELGKNSESV